MSDKKFTTEDYLNMRQADHYVAKIVLIYVAIAAPALAIVIDWLKDKL